jgi:ParB-like chromosome segregation protein Spo0J
MTIESLPIAKLCADPANVRVHSARNLDAIKASLHRFGQQKPIVVDARGIVRAGNGTLAAAQALGWTHIQVVRTDLMSSDATAYSIADNRTADLSEWDEAALAKQMESLRDDGINLTDLGFDEREIHKLLDEAQAAMENETDASEKTEDEIQEQWLVLVTCKDESDQTAFLQQMQREDRTCRALMS